MTEKKEEQFKDDIIAYLDKGYNGDRLLNLMPKGKQKIFAAGVILAHKNPDLDLEKILKFGYKYQDHVLDVLEGAYATIVPEEEA